MEAETPDNQERVILPGSALARARNLGLGLVTLILRSLADDSCVAR